MSAYGALAKVYDQLTEDVGYERRADYIEKLFKRSRLPVHTVLDLACGTGEMTAILTRRGYELVAADASPEMLAQAREKAADLEGEPPVFLNQSMTGLDLYGTVDAAICCLDSLNYLTSPKDVQKCFQRLHLFIAPGGLLVFDVNTPEKLAAMDGQVFLDETEDVYCVWRTEFERRSKICSYWMDIFTRREDGGWDRAGEEHRQRAYEVDELKAWLLDAGFTRIRTFGDCRMSAPREGAQRIYFSAIRGK
ncbi:MAG: class I SAM-dependent methyltransferase [Oscillospiraceae bacterium]|jgi:ubiquinone/menaquinone biosynthesis C-methylase UbiE|nr:class I SAM-dependent methyltransferase [Oscillospiraceae bacterium]MDE6996436.1 class I SAM-dependent methyltransferase [Oscillospiraceae bacterium]